MSAMSKDPEDYVEAHRALSLNRDESRRRRSFHATNTKMSLGDEKQTVFQKLKSFFKKEKKLGVDDDGDEKRGRDDAQVSKKRSRSASRFFGIGGQSQNGEIK